MSERISVERVGGFAGFGGPNLKSRGSVALDALDARERGAIDALFDVRADRARGQADGFCYRITRGTTTVEVDETRVPTVLRACLKDELA